jgi:hypothetical protein
MTAYLEETAGLGVSGIDPQEVKRELLSKYPTKVARKRAKQIIVNQPGEAGRYRKSAPTPAPFRVSSPSAAVPMRGARA